MIRDSEQEECGRMGINMKPVGRAVSLELKQS